jgi:glycine cleavage system H lipoate-binding protein
MSILFVLLTFLVVMTINYFCTHALDQPPAQPQLEVPLRPRVPVMAKEHGFTIPQDYSFHPGHTWVLQEGHENARVGLDSFGAELIGKIDEMEVISPGRWVRQGQPLVRVKSGDSSINLMSPVEGVVMSINEDVVHDPALASRDPYKDGWIAVLRSPDLPTNQKNLLKGPMVAPWMHYNVTRLNSALTRVNPALAQDGGTPLDKVLVRVDSNLRQRLIKDFFLN